MRKTRMVLLAAVAFLLSAPAVAQARWGPKENCSEATHCYALKQYEDSGLRQGGQAEINTETARLTAEGFITHEMWAAYRLANSGASEGWVETGQISNGFDGGGMHPFFASQTQDGKHFYLYEQPGTVPLNAWHSYLILWDGGTCDHVFWGQKSEPSSWVFVHTYCGFRAMEEIESGQEVSSNREPFTSGWTALAVERNNVWHADEARQYIVDPGSFLHVVQGDWAQFGVCCGAAPWAATALATPAKVANKSGTTESVTPAAAINGGEETLTVYHGKYKLTAPVPPSTPKPKGDTLAFMQSKAGRITGRYVGEGNPNIEDMRGPGWEMH